VHKVFKKGLPVLNTFLLGEQDRVQYNRLLVFFLVYMQSRRLGCYPNLKSINVDAQDFRYATPFLLNFTTTIQTIFWAFLVTYIINIVSRISFILISSTRLSHTINILTSVTHKAVAIPPKVVMVVTALAAYDAVRVC
jgi:steroid 5-alpha reductase family enzyme